MKSGLEILSLGITLKSNVLILKKKVIPTWRTNKIVSEIDIGSTMLCSNPFSKNTKLCNSSCNEK